MWNKIHSNLHVLVSHCYQNYFYVTFIPNGSIGDFCVDNLGSVVDFKMLINEIALLNDWKCLQAAQDQIVVEAVSSSKQIDFC